MAVNDLAQAVDPTKKKIAVPGQPTDDPAAQYSGGNLGAGLGSPTDAPAYQNNGGSIAGAINGAPTDGPQSQNNGGGIAGAINGSPTDGPQSQNNSAGGILGALSGAPSQNNEMTTIGPATPDGPMLAPGNAGTSVGAPTAYAGGGTTAPPAGSPPDPFAASGGGVFFPSTGQWIPKNNATALSAAQAGGAAPSPSTPLPTPGAAAPGAPAAPGAAPAAGAAAPGAPPSTIAGSFQEALIKALNPAAVTANDPSIAGSIQANKLSQQRSFEDNRNMLAERAAANGVSNSGGFETGLTGMAEDRAQQEGQYAADAVQHGQDQQTQKMMQALGIGGAYATSQNQLAQQGSQFDRSLAQSGSQFDQDAALRRLGIDSQNSLGQGDLALRGRLGDAQSNLGLLSALMQNNQFGQQLGQQGAQFSAGLDQQGLLGLLGLL